MQLSPSIFKAYDIRGIIDQTLDPSIAKLIGQAFGTEMRELGETSQQAHAQIGELCAQLGIDHIVTINAPDYGLNISNESLTSLHACQTQEEALQFASHINPGDVILCKGSRSEKLELVAEGIIEMWERQTQ